MNVHVSVDWHGKKCIRFRGRDEKKIEYLPFVEEISFWIFFHFYYVKIVDVLYSLYALQLWKWIFANVCVCVCAVIL